MLLRCGHVELCISENVEYCVVRTQTLSVEDRVAAGIDVIRYKHERIYLLIIHIKHECVERNLQMHHVESKWYQYIV